jgi:hypothetical protein
LEGVQNSYRFSAQGLGLAGMFAAATSIGVPRPAPAIQANLVFFPASALRQKKNKKSVNRCSVGPGILMD